MICKECSFWDSDKNICTDEEEYINNGDGESCCRYHPDAILIEEGIMSEQTRGVDEVLTIMKHTTKSMSVSQAKTDLHAIFKRVMEGEKKADPTCYCDGSGKDPDGMCDCEFTRNEAIDRAIQVHGMMMGVGEG